MVLSNVIVDITISSRSFVFSQSDVQISAGLTNIEGLAVAAFDFINCSPSVARFVFVSGYSGYCAVNDETSICLGEGKLEVWGK